MPVESIIEKERRLVITTAWGRATIDEFMGHQERLLSDPAFSPEFDQLLDGSGVTELAVSSNDVKSFTTTNNSVRHRNVPLSLPIQHTSEWAEWPRPTTRYVNVHPKFTFFMICILLWIG
jgi:hypothetical protein